MNVFTRNHGTSYRQQLPLTMEQLRQRVPSAFAMSAHSSRSDKFAYIRTVDVIEGMMKEGLQPYSAVQGGSRIAGKAEFTKHMIKFRPQGSAVPMILGDTVTEVVLINAHDGTSAYQLSQGVFRLVCLNGMMKSVGDGDGIRIPHKGNIIDQVIEGSNRILSNSGNVAVTIENWNALQLSAGEQDAFAEAAHTLRFGVPDGDGGIKVETPITAAQLLMPRRSEDRQSNGSNWNRPANDLWRTLNVVQENSIKGGLSARAPRTEEGRGRMTTTHAIRGIDQDVKLNRALWQLAERMAELKGVRVAA